MRSAFWAVVLGATVLVGTAIGRPAAEGTVPDGIVDFVDEREAFIEEEGFVATEIKKRIPPQGLFVVELHNNSRSHHWVNHRLVDGVTGGKSTDMGNPRKILPALIVIYDADGSEVERITADSRSFTYLFVAPTPRERLEAGEKAVLRARRIPLNPDSDFPLAKGNFARIYYRILDYGPDSPKRWGTSIGYGPFRSFGGSPQQRLTDTNPFGLPALEQLEGLAVLHVRSLRFVKDPAK